MIGTVPLLLLAGGVVVVGLSLRELLARAREGRHGVLEAVDAGVPLTLRSERYRLVGRPDAIRRLPDGRRVPVEVKHRTAPAAGPFPSHLAQLRAYCLLLEENDGRPPPYGVLRYADREFRVAWNAAARREIVALRRSVDRPYDGRATPSVGRCGGCRWAARCDARA